MKRVFTLVILILLVFSSTIYAQLPELLYYKFDAPGTSVQNHALTPVGSNPATITGTGLSIGNVGLHGTALVGTGVTSTSGVINTGWLTNLSGSFTIAFWTSAIVPSSTLWYIWGDQGANDFRCFTNGVAGANNWIIRGGNLPDLLISNGATMAPNMIHAVYDATTQQYRAYLNGVLVNTVTASFTSMTGTGFQVGGSQTRSNLNGLMDEFRIYNRALSQAEITATFNTTLGAMTDLALQSFVNMPDSLCSGPNDIMVRMKNNGPHTLSSAKIDWKVNNVSQTTYNWSGNLAINDSVVVTIGSYSFDATILHDITAFVSEVNNGPDTINNANDTITKTNIFVKTTPAAVPLDTSLIICPGDSVVISCTLAGLPPWNMEISDGTTTHTFNNLMSTAFSQVFYPTVTTTYTISSLTDATGCVFTSATPIVVTAMPPPPAVITPMGSPAACMGDSVTLMASVGLNFSYEWFRDNVAIPGADSYVYHAKLGGDYTVNVTSPNGCKATSAPQSVIIHPLPVVNLGNDTALLPVQSILLNAGPGFNSYLWSTGAVTQSILVDSSGVGIGVKTIWVHVTDNYYCLGGDTILINFTNHPGIDEALANADIRIIPNPSDGRIELQFSNIPAGQYDIEIFSPDGKAVYRSKHQLNNDKINLDLSHIANGVYLLKVSGTAGTVSERIVIRN